MIQGVHNSMSILTLYFRRECSLCVCILFFGVEKGTLKSVIISEKKIFKKSFKYNINSQRVKL